MTSRDVSDEQLGQLARRQYDLFRRVREGSIPVETALFQVQEILEREGRKKNTIMSEMLMRFTVPEVSYTELLVLGDFGGDLDQRYLRKDLFRDERGKVFKPVIWEPGRKVTTEEVREHFREVNAVGNTIAFITWVMRNIPQGHYSTVLDEPQLPYDDVPSFVSVTMECELGLYDKADPWPDHWAFVAFHEIKD
jgi:hypothetical protein